MQGMEALLTHVPALRGARGPLIFLLALTLFGGASGVMYYADTLWPEGTLVTQVAMILIGFLNAAQFFWRRQEYKTRWGDEAYWHAFTRHVATGLPLLFAAIFHTLYLPGPRLIASWGTPFSALLGLYFVVTGLMLYVQAYIVFGVDNLAMLYVYFPKEGRLVNSSIYGLLRHPAYSGVVRIGLAFGLWRGTLWSVLFGLFMPIGLSLWVRLVEEPELLERFGEGYADYRRRVPAFWPRLPEWRKFFRFLISGQ